VFGDGDYGEAGAEGLGVVVVVVVVGRVWDWSF